MAGRTLVIDLDKRSRESLVVYGIGLGYVLCWFSIILLIFFMEFITKGL